MSLVLTAATLNVITPVNTIEVYTSALGATIIAITGFAIMMIGWWQFKQRGVAICPTEKTASLITNGIYRHTRNPMYLGLTLILIGVAMTAGTLTFYIAAAAFFAIIHLRFCPYEEAKLRTAFGQEYIVYSSQVRRWI